VIAAKSGTFWQAVKHAATKTTVIASAKSFFIQYLLGKSHILVPIDYTTGALNSQDTIGFDKITKTLHSKLSLYNAKAPCLY